MVIPDYSKIFKFEAEREYIIMRYGLLHPHPPLMKCFARRAYLHYDKFEKTVDKLDYKIDSRLTSDTEGSNTAFALLDSIKAVEHIRHIIMYNPIII